MKQETTAFLAAAQARGCETQIGIDMLFEQIPAYLEFFGFPPPTPVELREVARGRLLRTGKQTRQGGMKMTAATVHEPQGRHQSKNRGRERLDRLGARIL